MEYSLRVTQISASKSGLSWGIILSGGASYLNDRCSDRGLRLGNRCPRAFLPWQFQLLGDGVRQTSRRPVHCASAFRCFEGVHHRRSNVWMVRICLQFPDCIKSVQQFSQELPFSSGSSKLTRNREPICFASSDALRLWSIECRCGLLCLASCPAFRQGGQAFRLRLLKSLE